MATTSEIDVGMNAIAQRLYDQRQVMLKVKQNATGASASLAAIPTDFAAVVSAVQAFGTTDPYEAAVKAKLAKLTTEFNALKTVADAVAGANLG
ncbi:hypothetical protein [Mesorhizobium sp. WSM3862]|uniref:hypothetical protein n=1 Tax=Mesorhizobium sp. WSM3862 TaxID=632858 RepID=UPI000BAFBF15|nr:hypothetical protein [Mesorhizobium sp. WSM3862]PBB96448.1 hypothetical protein CK224_19190 [Mesorhizobium sp. WSM3862]